MELSLRDVYLLCVLDILKESDGIMSECSGIKNAALIADAICKSINRVKTNQNKDCFHELKVLSLNIDVLKQIVEDLQDKHTVKPRIQIPKDWEVQPLRDGDTCPGRTTCGTCELSWDDDLITGLTPVPSGRCPFEPFHVGE